MSLYPVLLRPVSLPDDVAGHLYLRSMPGCNEPLGYCLTQMHQHGVNRLVSLTPLDEIERMSPELYAALQSGLGVTWQHHPISNFGVPEDQVAFYQLVRDLATALRQGETILVHCYAGIGRTGTLAVCVLLDLGLTLDEATRVVHRAGSGPETAGQRHVVASYAQYLKDKTADF